MFERQFGLRENPFAAGHQSKYVYPSREHQEALAHLRFGIENREPFVLITGEVGTGKTTALYDALSEWKSRAVVALITNSALTRSELYEEICLRFGVQLVPPVSKPMLMGQLERHLLVVRARGDFGILLVDEAQNLDRGLLEEVRLLSNLEAQGEKLLQIFLVGQPELEEKLMQPELRQLRQRIAVHYRLRPLNQEDTERYIHHRISVAGGHALTVFPSDACVEVFRMTHGIPREINTVAAQALLNAFVEDSPSVKPDHVLAVQRDTEFKSVLDGPVAAGTPNAAANPTAAKPSVAAPTAMTPAPPVAPPAPPPASLEPPALAPSGEGHGVNRPSRVAPQAEPTPPEPHDHEPRGTGGAPPSPASVLPAGSAETWQTWMDSLSQRPPAEAAQTEAESFSEMSWENALAEEREAARAQAETNETPEPEEEFDVEEEAQFGDEEPDVVPFGDPAADPVTEPVASRPQPEMPSFEDLEPPRSIGPPPVPRSAPEPEPDVEEPLKFELESISMAPQHATPAAARPAPPMPPDEPARPAPNPPMSAIASAPSRLKPAAAPYALPPRLRERLEAGERENIRASRATGWLIGIGALAAVVVAVVLTLRFRAHSGAPAPSTSSASVPASPPAAAEPSASPASEPTPPPGPVEKPATVVSPPPPRATPKPAPALPAGASAASGASMAAAPAATPEAQAVPKTLFGIAVGSYLVEGRANTEKARLSGTTGLPGRVVASTDGEFSVVLGAFEVRSNAENTAGDLIAKGLVEEARVMTFANPAYKPASKP